MSTLQGVLLVHRTGETLDLFGAGAEQTAHSGILEGNVYSEVGREGCEA